MQNLDQPANAILCQFYQEACEFKKIPPTRKDYIIGKARKVTKR